MPNQARQISNGQRQSISRLSRVLGYSSVFSCLAAYGYRSPETGTVTMPDKNQASVIITDLKRRVAEFETQLETLKTYGGR